MKKKLRVKLKRMLSDPYAFYPSILSFAIDNGVGEDDVKKLYSECREQFKTNMKISFQETINKND